ncbi:fructose-1,6-bisphosphate aldolase [Bacillus licheniformis]|nr:fructose-1,6-bisphosphate aldolase [Bacillus licheniformis]
MAFVSMKELLQEAKEHHYAIGQFNINGLQWTKAILEAAEEERSPVIAAASDRLIDYLGGFKTVSAMVAALIEEMSISVPVVLHLDHGKSPERCKQAIDAGFSSVMIDGSHSPIDENIAMTKEVVSYAGVRNVSVEAEVGTVGAWKTGLSAECSMPTSVNASGLSKKPVSMLWQPRSAPFMENIKASLIWDLRKWKKSHG